MFPSGMSSHASTDYEMAPSSIPLDYSVRSLLSHTKFKVIIVFILVFTQFTRNVYLSYISEAAASLLDERLSLNIVPRTQLVSLSSQVSMNHFHGMIRIFTSHQAFFYDWLDRSAAKKGKPLPDKIGSMQLFMHGYSGKLLSCHRHQA